MTADVRQEASGALRGMVRAAPYAADGARAGAGAGAIRLAEPDDPARRSLVRWAMAGWSG
ncbi:hypothetical protein [Sphingomonas adhaesiva]|uniref:hypothetical protein n=1 Tax=Sphingomonas adhaesiva TaxID=28212 RepID=UPI002FF98EAB